MAIITPILSTPVNHTLDLVPENPLFNKSNIKELDIEDIYPQTFNQFGFYKKKSVKQCVNPQCNRKTIIKQQKTFYLFQSNILLL